MKIVPHILKLPVPLKLPLKKSLKKVGNLCWELKVPSCLFLIKQLCVWMWMVYLNYNMNEEGSSWDRSWDFSLRK